MNADNLACLKRHLAAEGRHDMEATLATLHPDCVFEDGPVQLYLRGPEQARRHYQLWWFAFGVTVVDGAPYWVADDRLIAKATYVGFHTGPFLGIAPTGREIRLPFVVEVGFRDQLLASEVFTYDLNHLLRQLGQASFDPSRAALEGE